MRQKKKKLALRVRYSTFLSQIAKVWSNLKAGRKPQISLLMCLMLFVSVAEVISIGAVVPFLGVLIAPERIVDYPYIQAFLNILDISGKSEILLSFTLFFVLLSFVAGISRMSLLLAQTKLSMAIAADFSVAVFERTLHQPYVVHINRNSSEAMAAAEKANDLVKSIVQPTLTIITSGVLLVFILITLFLIHPLVCLSILCSLITIYLIAILITREKISLNSKALAVQQGRVTKAIQEGLGGIRDVLLDGTQSVYAKAYRDAFRPLQSAMASNQVLGAAPRYIVESFGIAAIALTSFFIVTNTDGDSSTLSNSIPLIGALALGAQRLLPIIQQLYNSWITIKGNRNSIEDALVLLDVPLQTQVRIGETPQLVFARSVMLKQVGFRYDHNKPWILKDLNFKLRFGTSVGIHGTTGGGKSTFLDILMGLLNPTLGELYVDEIEINAENLRSWQSCVSHVPQHIYLSDASIRENIAFGVSTDRIDMARVEYVAAQAQILEMIESLPEGYETLVGERGVRLSGGQRQRLGIARALYRQPRLLVLDEATSALDMETERDVMNSIEALCPDTTLVIVAHRLSTLERCDEVYRMRDGKLI